ncbi:MAG: serine/threonine-protein kinase [Planctomycetota bacterium]
MAARHARCPRCGLRLSFEGAAGDAFRCGNCQTRLRVVGRTGRMSGEDGLVGQRLGDYEILERLGAGGMGAVYRAREAGGRCVALKLLPRSADGEAVARLAREGRAAAAVRDAHIIRVYASGRLSGLPFLAMEFVEGGSLQEAIDQEGYLGPATALRLMRQVAQALAKAHAVGLVHRDIKPANILLTAAGDAKLADFGLAKPTSAHVPGVPFLGTAHYSSPEAVLGRPLDARSDLYSLGATFYHALAGRPPFRANSDTGVLAEQAEGEPSPLDEVRPDLPRELCWVVEHLMCKHPEARFQSAGELLAALDAVEDGLEAPDLQPAGLSLSNLSRRGRRRAGRKRRVAWLTGAGLALILGLLVAAVARGQRSRSLPEPDERPTSPITAADVVLQPR